jgi:hypothetical protein
VTGAAPDTNPAIGGRNSTDTAYIWNIDNSGNLSTSGVISIGASGLATSGAMRLTNGDALGWRNATGTADLLLGTNASDHFSMNSYLEFTSASTGLVFSGRGTIVDSGSGGIALNASGSNQNISLSPSGTGGVVIGGGTGITEHLSGTASLDFSALAANSCEVLTLTVPGAADGDTAVLGIPNALADIDGGIERTTFFGWVSADNTVSVRRCNVTGSSTADPAAATVRADVWKH